MCGLVGIMGSNLFGKHKKAMQVLLFLDTLRGEDSTGIASVTRHGQHRIFKRAMPGPEFLTMPQVDGQLSLGDVIWIGHNRAATIGKKTRLNAHPFEILDAEDDSLMVVGAHNGTLKNKFELPNSKDYETDSECLYALIGEKGIKHALEQAEGAWALTYYDAFDDTMNLIRNKDRPLWFAFEKEHKTIIWASEKWMIEVACRREGVEIEEPMSLEEDTLYTFDMPANMQSVIDYKTTGGLVGKPPRFFQTGCATGTQTGGQQGTTQEGDTKSKQEEPPKVTALTVVQPKSLTTTSHFHGNKRNQFSGPNRGYKGRIITPTELENACKRGCGWCEEAEVKVKDAVGWLDDKTVVCGKCLTDTHGLFGTTPFEDDDNEVTKELRESEVKRGLHIVH